MRISDRYAGEDNVLLLDDQKATLFLVEDMLLDLGLSPVCFTNVESAQKHIDNNEIDLIITDYNIGGTRPLDLLRSLKNTRNEKAHVIIHSGLGSRSYEIRSILDLNGFNKNIQILNIPYCQKDLERALIQACSLWTKS